MLKSPAADIVAVLETAADLDALLDRAFAGQLVPQDPTDEPAPVLLEQIEMQRKNTYESRPRKRR